MRRRLFTVTLAISLVSCVGACVMWVRSYDHDEAACYRTRGGRRYTVFSQSGRVWFEAIHETHPFDASPRTDWGTGFWTYTSRRGAGGAEWPWERWYNESDYLVRRWGFRFVSGERLTPVPPSSPDLLGTIDFFPVVAVAAPYWFVAGVALIPPAIFAKRFRQHCRARQAGRCVACGYDLRASPDRCPECGANVGGSA